MCYSNIHVIRFATPEQRYKEGEAGRDRNRDTERGRETGIKREAERQVEAEIWREIETGTKRFIDR